MAQDGTGLPSGTLDLSGTWELHHTEDEPEHLMAADLRGREPLAARVPAPVHQVLMEAGLLEDPNYGLGSLRARWVEERYWVYRRTFDASQQAAGARAWLCFGCLELHARVLLNGEEVGRHANSLRPARMEVTGKLRDGENLLVVCVESGLHATVDRPSSCYSHDEQSRVTRRMWMRKPQYQCGWDWNPRLMSVGILGDVRLEWAGGPLIREVAVAAQLDESLTAANLRVGATLESGAELALPVVLRARVMETGDEVSLSCLAPSSADPEARWELEVPLRQPSLWWPAGQGAQPLYHVEVTLEGGGSPRQVVLRTGIRRVKLDQSTHPVEGTHFILRVNGRPIFCKGANWVPADLFHSAVPAAKTKELVRLAAEANFNLLRVWGGGPYASHELCDACDEAGVLLWHDFPFACSKYPGDDPEFAREVALEARAAARELARHPSLAVWCGNNEIAWGDAEWPWSQVPPERPHDGLFFDVFPKVVAEESPGTPYWPSSPYSPEGYGPNDPRAGDQHPWEVSLMQPGGADFWRYRAQVDRFPNEGGVLGASSPATLRQFLPDGERRLLSPSWVHHDNPFAHRGGAPGKLGRAYQTVELWTGLDPLSLPWGRHAFASALLQAEGLREYILNYRRRMFSSAAAIFWMYNDSWPVTHGWTIVDYYLRRKLAYHPVRRAFQPVTVALAQEDGEVRAYGVNDTQDAWRGELRLGLFRLAGGFPLDRALAVELPPNTSTLLGSLPLRAWQELGLKSNGAFAVLSRDGRTHAQDRLFLERFGDLEFPAAPIELRREGQEVVLSSSAFAWGVCLDLDGELPLRDNC
ncbi:MAG TPA: hypothetical protein VGN26_08635, partial [Armatimonadota bacterium]